MLDPDVHCRASGSQRGELVEHLEPALLWLAGICAALLSVMGLFSKLKAPYNALATRVEDLEHKVEANQEHLEKDLKRLDKQSRISQMDLESLTLILEHLATGNHNQQMQDQADKIKRFMVEETTNVE